MDFRRSKSPPTTSSNKNCKMPKSTSSSSGKRTMASSGTTFSKKQQKDVVINEKEISKHIQEHYEKMTGLKAENCLLSKNLSKWARTAQQYWYEQCKEDFAQVKNDMGQILEIQTKAVIKPKMGDVRQLVLPGGGDVASRVWASMRVKTESLRRWMSKGAFSTAAAKDAINQLENFMIGEGQLYEHVWKNIDNKVAFKLRSKSCF